MYRLNRVVLFVIDIDFYLPTHSSILNSSHKACCHKRGAKGKHLSNILKERLASSVITIVETVVDHHGFRNEDHRDPVVGKEVGEQGFTNSIVHVDVEPSQTILVKTRFKKFVDCDSEDLSHLLKHELRIRRQLGEGSNGSVTIYCLGC